MASLLLAKWKLLLAGAIDPRLSKAAVAALAAVVDRVNKDSRGAFPSFNRIAEDARISRRHAVRAVKSLRALGYLNCVSGNRHRSNVYGMGKPASDARVTKSVTAMSPILVSPMAPESIDSNLLNESVMDKDRCKGARIRPDRQSRKSAPKTKKHYRAEQFAVLDAAKEKILAGLEGVTRY